MVLILLCLNLLGSTAVLYVMWRRSRPKRPTRIEFETAVHSAANLLREAQEWLNVEKQAHQLRPIPHAKVEGPKTARMTSAIGYWVPKDKPDAEPFLAAWYEKDTTWLESGTVFSPEDVDLTTDEVRAKYLNMVRGNAGNDIIPADTYVDLTGQKIPGARFRSLYVPSPTVTEVAKFKPKAPLRNANLITAKASALMTPEDEQKLAEEYELGSKRP